MYTHRDSQGTPIASLAAMEIAGRVGTAAGSMGCKVGFVRRHTYELGGVRVDAWRRRHGRQHVALRAQDEEGGQSGGIGSQQVEVPRRLAEHEALHTVLQLTWGHVAGTTDVMKIFRARY